MADAGSARSALHHPRQWHMIGEIDLAGMIAGHAALRRLCDRLERIADALPARPDADETQWCRAELEAFMPRDSQRDEHLFHGEELEDVSIGLFVIDQIRSAHLLDRIHAQDLAAALSDEREQPVPAETLAYMLRCFFDGCRRAMAFEKVALLMLAGQRLTPTARALLIDSLGASVRSG